MKTIPAEACWIIGQELDRFDETRATATMLFERALEKPSSNSMNQIEYSPVAKLVDAYTKAGRKEEARKLLLRHLKSATFDNYDFEYASYQQVENATWVAKKLQAMDCPVDAIRLYRQLLDDPNKLASTTRYSGRTVDYYEKIAKTGMSQAISSMDASQASEAVTQLLLVPETMKPGAAAIDLMLMTPAANELASGTMKSSYVELLLTLSKDAPTSLAIANRFSEIAAQYPADLSIAVASTAWKLGIKDAEAKQSVRQLVELASSHQLESIAEGRRPNSRRHREAALAIPLWLVARECLQHDELREFGQPLAEQALQAARRQVGIKEQSTILYEWGKLLLENGNKEEAEARWSELLELATQRPERSAKTASPKTSFRLPSGVTRVAAVAMQLQGIGHASLRLPIHTVAMQLSTRDCRRPATADPTGFVAQD